MSMYWLHRFKIYHNENPHIYKEFERLTFQAIRAKRQHFAVHVIIGKMRWDSAISGNDEFKINENYCPYYGRLFEELHPHHEGFFRKKDILPEDTSVADYVGMKRPPRGRDGKKV